MDAGTQHRSERAPPRRHRRSGRQYHRVVRLLHLRKPGRDPLGQVLRKEPPRGRLPQHGGPLLHRVPHPTARRVRLRLARRQGGPQIHLPRHAQRHGLVDGADRRDSDVRQDRSAGGGPALRAAPHPGSLPGRRIRRRHHLRCRAHLGREARLLHRVAADLAHARHRRLARRHHQHPHGARHRAIQRLGWRIPFIISLLLVMIAVYIRLSLQETPIFQEIKAKGRTATNPWREAFLSSNIKYVGIASIVVLGQGCVWYSGQFWALYFLQTVKKLDVLTSSYIVGAALLIATPTLIFWGWLSDKIGRKPIILSGMAIASLTYYPLYSLLGRVANPGAVNYPLAILIVAILVNYVGMTYAPIAAFLAEFFPGRIRYTSVSVPYHIGNGWGGGLVPIITTSAYLSTGSVGAALIYPIALPAVCFVL